MFVAVFFVNDEERKAVSGGGLAKLLSPARLRIIDCVILFPIDFHRLLLEQVVS